MSLRSRNGMNVLVFVVLLVRVVWQSPFSTEPCDSACSGIAADEGLRAKRVHGHHSLVQMRQDFGRVTELPAEADELHASANILNQNGFSSLSSERAMEELIVSTLPADVPAQSTLGTNMANLNPRASPSWVTEASFVSSNLDGSNALDMAPASAMIGVIPSTRNMVSGMGGMAVLQRGLLDSMRHESHIVGSGSLASAPGIASTDSSQALGDVDPRSLNSLSLDGTSNNMPSTNAFEAFEALGDVDLRSLNSLSLDATTSNNMPSTNAFGAFYEHAIDATMPDPGILTAQVWESTAERSLEALRGGAMDPKRVNGRSDSKTLPRQSWLQSWLRNQIATVWTTIGIHLVGPTASRAGPLDTPADFQLSLGSGLKPKAGHAILKSRVASLLSNSAASSDAWDAWDMGIKICSILAVGSLAVFLVLHLLEPDEKEEDINEAESCCLWFWWFLNQTKQM